MVLLKLTVNLIFLFSVSQEKSQLKKDLAFSVIGVMSVLLAGVANTFTFHPSYLLFLVCPFQLNTNYCYCCLIEVTVLCLDTFWTFNFCKKMGLLFSYTSCNLVMPL